MLSNYRVYFTLSAALLKPAIKCVFSFRQTFPVFSCNGWQGWTLKLESAGIFEVLNLCMEKWLRKLLDKWSLLWMRGEVVTSCYHGSKISGWQQTGKPHVKLFQTSSISFSFNWFDKCWLNFLGLNPKGHYLS